MAARVLLLSVLITEVLKPACAAGVKGIGGNISGRNVSKQDSDIGLTKRSGLTVEIQPSGHVILGKKGITLNCIADSNETVTWLYNGIPAPPCGLTRCVLSNGSLQIYKKQLQKQNSQVQKFKGKERNSIVNHNKDEYRCVIRTNLGELIKSAPTFIQIAELAHVFKESPENITIYEGEVARLSCLIDSVPFPPNITWQHNETLLSYHNESKYSTVPPGVLYISATKLSDAGSYRCIVTNEFLKKTKRSKETKLIVISRAESNKSHTPSSLFPQVSYDHWLLNGSSLNLACVASGYPSPLVTWSFIPRYIDNVTKPRILLNSTTGISKLSLRSVNVSDAGVYMCSSQNSITNDLEVQNITVDVLVPPSFISTPTDQICPNGRTARFECQAQGLPLPQIYWLKDSLNITINEARRTIYVKEYNKTELAISATVPSDSGIYQCVAVNAAGEIWAAGRLQVITSRNSPDTPTSLKCQALSPFKILISWEPPKSVPYTSITAYTVHYSPLEGGKEEVSPEPGNSTFVEVTKLLEPFTNYSFYVRVWNAYGASNQSATIVCSTDPIPKGTPKMHVDIISSTKLNVSWEPLSKKESRGVVVEYKLLWKLHHSSSFRWVQHLPASVHYYILSGLEPGAQYDLRVLARTKQGEPNISEAELDWVNVTMPSAESNQFTIRNVVDIQVLIINASIIKMKWKIDFKQSDEIESKFDSWKIYCENQNGEKLKNINLPQNITEYLFTDLDMNVSYTMHLCMVNSGETTACLTKYVETVQSDPNIVPMALEAIPVSPTSINVSWTLSDVNDVNSFEFCYHPVHAQNSNSSKCTIVNDTKTSIDKLKPFTLYEFKVTAIKHDANQSNFYSKSIECYTNEDVPGQVEKLQWYLVNNTKVQITWDEPSNINGVIQNYFVMYSMDSSMMWSRNVTVVGNKRMTSLPGLVPGKHYFVKVQAATKAGYGKPSNTIAVFTGGTNLNDSNSDGGSGTSKVPAPSGNEKNSKPDQSLGVILGVGISVGFIMICLCSIYCRRKFENSRLRNDAQSTNGCALSRNRNGCCMEQSSTSVSQQANTAGVPNEIELAVLCPSSPIETNPHSDAKGTQSNGIFEICAKEPLLSPWEVNGGSKDVHIMENPQYKRRGSSASNNQQEEEEEEQDLEGTQLTMVNCTLGSSASSLNNNSGCPDGETSSSPKATCASVPALGPNG